MIGLVGMLRAVSWVWLLVLFVRGSQPPFSGSAV
jgi:hypothetical protein